jgi:peptidyl-tRNA hydrolase
MKLAVRIDLGTGRGEIAAQVAHATTWLITES